MRRKREYQENFLGEFVHSSAGRLPCTTNSLDHMEVYGVSLLQRAKLPHWIHRVGDALTKRFWLVELLLIVMIFIIRAASSG